MLLKAGRDKGKMLAGASRTKKRKADETEDLEVQEDSTESPTSKRTWDSGKISVLVHTGPYRVSRRYFEANRLYIHITLTYVKHLRY